MQAWSSIPRAVTSRAADMAADLERTLIAARYSSRELAKLLHELYLPADEPVVVVEDDRTTREPTMAITATETLPPTERTPPATPRPRDASAEGALRAETSRAAVRRAGAGRIKIAAGRVRRRG